MNFYFKNIHNIDFMDRGSSFSVLQAEEVAHYLRDLGANWSLKDNKVIRRQYAFASYVDGFAFVNTVAEFAEKINHHPNLLLGYKYVDVEIWTHNLDCLTLADFGLAAKIECIYDL